MKRVIPWTMVWVRVGLGPVMVLGAFHAWAGWFLACIVAFALIDDIFDGILARRWGTETPVLRLADSSADTVFYLGVAWAVWLRFPEVWRSNLWLLAGLFAFEGLRYVFDFWKFRKGASYHSYLAKFWGLVIASAMIGVFAFGGAPRLVRAAILLGILVNAEGMAMSLMLPTWQNDMKTLAVAYRLREKLLSK